MDMGNLRIYPFPPARLFYSGLLENPQYGNAPDLPLYCLCDNQENTKG